MKKKEFIEKYGEDAWKRNLENMKKWHINNRERQRELERNFWKGRPGRLRSNGITKYCNKDVELIENYELAKADNFDAKKWHLHHRLENYWSSKTLLKKKLYYNVNPEALIWLPAKEHKIDSALATFHPELSKWHKRILE